MGMTPLQSAIATAIDTLWRTIVVLELQFSFNLTDDTTVEQITQHQEQVEHLMRSIELLHELLHELPSRLNACDLRTPAI